jgi:glycosyltransferase involved in cell wall biosynthesis
MSLPKLTVIIPTLSRPDTLYFTLKTVLNQRYSNYSILVSDNFSNDNTRDVVESFKNNKINYINTGQRLSMSHHWEFALAQVEDGYVTVLGDDDGMLPNALDKVAAIINRHQLPAVGWRFGNFNWAGLPPHFMIPMANYYRIVDSSTEIKKIFERSIYHTIEFPSLYGGFIDVALLKQIRQQQGGKFFHSRIPDFFSGAMVAASVKQYIRLEFPITINATSRHSAGFATINKSNDQKAFVDLQTAHNIPFHKKLIFIRSNAVPIAEAMLQVAELKPGFPRVDIKKILEEVAAEASITPDEEKYIELKEGVKQIAGINQLDIHAKELLAKLERHPQPAIVKKKFSPVSLSLYVDTTNSGLDTVEDACDLAAFAIPPNYFRFKNNLSKNYSRLTGYLRFLWLKYFSEKKNYFK